MTTRQISILGANTVPDSTGRCFFETYDVKATNDQWKHMVATFNQPSTQTHGIYGQFAVPNDFVGTAVIFPVWTSTATSGNCKWQFEYRVIGGDDTTSLDQSGVVETGTVTDVAPGAANRRMVPTLAVTSANFSAGSTVEFYFTRTDAASSEMAAAATLHDLIFQYSDV